MRKYLLTFQDGTALTIVHESATVDITQYQWVKDPENSNKRYNMSLVKTIELLPKDTK